MSEFLDLFEASKKLRIEANDLIESLVSLDPFGKVFLDCSGTKTRSGISHWLGMRIIEGIEKESMAMPAKAVPLTHRSMMDLKGRIADKESGLSLFKGLEVTLKSDWGPKKRVLIDEKGEPLLNSDGSYLTEDLIHEEIQLKRIEIEFIIRFTSRLQGIINRPPNPAALIHRFDFERLISLKEDESMRNTPPGEGVDIGGYHKEDTDKKSVLKNFFSDEILNLRTPHSIYIAGLEVSKIKAPDAWRRFKELAKESMGTHYEEFYGFPPVYLKLYPKDPKNIVLYKYESFEGPQDPGDGKITKNAFAEAFRRAKDASKST